MKLGINVNKENDVVNIVLSGQITTVTAPDFDKAVSENLAGTKLMIIDFKDCPYVSSAGLRVLMKAYQTMEPAGGKVKLINVCETFMEVLKITYLDDVFDIECAE